MQQLSEKQKKRGIRQEIIYVGDDGRIKKEFRYRGMIIFWDSHIIKGKFYYWRASFYSSLDAAANGIDRHINHYNKI